MNTYNVNNYNNLYNYFFPPTKLSMLEMLLITTLVDLSLLFVNALNITNKILQYTIYSCLTICTLIYVKHLLWIYLIALTVTALTVGIKEITKKGKNVLTIKHTHMNYENDKEVKNTSSTNIIKNISTNNTIKNISFYDICRMKLSLLVIICVFLSDFNNLSIHNTSINLYHSAKLGKSFSTLYIKLMDFGVGCFALNGGYVYRFISGSRILVGSILCFILGIIRSIIVIRSNNFEDSSEFKEFGMHLNLLLILSVVSMIFVLLKKINISDITVIIASLLLLIVHEVFCNVYYIHIMDNLMRTNIFTKNMEGIVLIAPIIGIMGYWYGMSGIIRRYVHSRRNMLEISMSLLCYCMLYVYSFFYSILYRRIHNLGFTTTIGVVCMGNGLISRVVAEYLSVNNLSIKNNAVVLNLSRNILISLVVSNVLVFVNKKWILKKISEKYQIGLVIGGYMTVVYLVLKMNVKKVIKKLIGKKESELCM